VELVSSRGGEAVDSKELVKNNRGVLCPGAPIRDAVRGAGGYLLFLILNLLVRVVVHDHALGHRRLREWW